MTKSTEDFPNKITTKSYLVKRLRDSGYVVDKLDTIEYANADSRKFTILVDNGLNSILLTVLKNGELHFYDGNRVFSAESSYNFSETTVTKGKNKKIQSPIEHLVEFLNDNGIVNKHRNYTNQSTENI